MHYYLVLMIQLSVIQVTITNATAAATPEEELTALLELAIGPSSNTFKAFATVCVEDSSPQSRTLQSEQLKVALIKSFKEVLQSNLNMAELMENKFVKTVILSSIKEYSRICSSDSAMPAQRILQLRTSAGQILTKSYPVPVPTSCNWFGRAPFCNGKCPEGYTWKMYDDYGDGSKCVTGRKSYCCV